MSEKRNVCVGISVYFRNGQRTDIDFKGKVDVLEDDEKFSWKHNTKRLYFKDEKDETGTWEDILVTTMISKKEIAMVTFIHQAKESAPSKKQPIISTVKGNA